MRANRLPLLPSHAGTHSRWRETALLERTREREPQCVTGASEGVDEGSSGCRGGIRSRRITHQRMGNKIMEAADAQREKGIRSRVTDESTRHPRMQSLHLHYANEQTLTHTRRSCTHLLSSSPHPLSHDASRRGARVCGKGISRS